MSNTLSYLTSNIRDARLHDWQIEPTLHQNLYEKLSEDILAYEKWVDQANQKEAATVSELLSLIKQSMNEIYPNAEVFSENHSTKNNLFCLVLGLRLVCHWDESALERHRCCYQTPNQHIADDLPRAD